LPGTNGTGPPVPRIELGGARSSSGLSFAVHLGFPVVTDKYDAIAAAYAAQDPAAYLPDGNSSHPTLIAGYKAFQKLHAKQLRRKNVSFLGQMLSASPGGLVENLHVLSHGTININPERPEAEPVVDYRALTNPADMDIMVEMVWWMRKYMKSEDFAKYAPAETTPGANVVEYDDIAAWIRRQYTPTIYHPVGTAAKMPRELGGVVGEDLKVHGTERLSIVDASIMPSIPGGPTSQTVYAVAEKVSILKIRRLYLITQY
jgi:choline dehydrogenase